MKFISKINSKDKKRLSEITDIYLSKNTSLKYARYVAVLMFILVTINPTRMPYKYSVPAFLFALFAFLVSTQYKSICNQAFFKAYGNTIFEFNGNKVEVYTNQKLQAKFTMDEVEIIYIDKGIVFCKKLKKKKFLHIKHIPIPFFFDELSIAEKETLLKIIKEAQKGVYPKSIHK